MFYKQLKSMPLQVALLAEGVDRNDCAVHKTGKFLWSPSSRRAWIEILVLDFQPEISYVALLAEGVDRNEALGEHAAVVRWSPSSRRAWIEISQICSALSMMFVALLAEGVDRNTAGYLLALRRSRRPPRGGRG